MDNSDNLSLTWDIRSIPTNIKMEIKELEKFIEEEIKKLERYYKEKGEEELTLAMTAKMAEEMGELINEILAHKGFQRKEKLENLNKEELEKEFTDVLVTALILAKRFNIKIEEAIKKRIDKLKSRKY